MESVSGDDALIGCFYNPYTRKNSLLIVPTTPREQISVSLRLKSGVGTATVWQGGSSSEMSASDGVLNLNIQAGDSVYLVF